MRLANNDDLREELELLAIELQDQGVAPRSIRKYVNDALKATKDRDGLRSTLFLRKYWNRESNDAAVA